jgi:hypothetical protein
LLCHLEFFEEFNRVVAFNPKIKEQPAFQAQFFPGNTRLLRNKSNDAICQWF